ncbi:MAG: acyl-CoA dehydrogenase [Bermanella sp.]|jgi:acyl-CoA dehydrogenase
MLDSSTSPKALGTLDEFRQQVRNWLAENCPPTMRKPVQSDDELCFGGRNWQWASEDQKSWLVKMASQGWTAPDWPVAYGGAGLNREQCTVLNQEMEAIGARPALINFGISMLGPALMKFGTEEQCLRHLPAAARGEIRWCQGYSEPGAGSDLASLRTRAEDRGDHFLLNGQKVWTSHADKSDWMFCLARTDSEASKHAGISFLLFDMASAGVETRPIQLISGASPFCETFLTDVIVPKEDLVGESGQGWTIAKYLLTHEREMIGSLTASAPLHKIIGNALDRNPQGQISDGSLRAHIASFETDDWAAQMTLQRLLTEAQAGASLGAASSLLKYQITEINKRKYELLMDIRGADALEWADDHHNTAQRWLRSKGNSIEGGTSEIQLNIIAKHILSLPGA